MKTLLKIIGLISLSITMSFIIDYIKSCKKENTRKETNDEVEYVYPSMDDIDIDIN
jgi:hypothetical protein